MMFREELGPPLTHKTSKEHSHGFFTQASLCVRQESLTYDRRSCESGWLA